MSTTPKSPLFGFRGCVALVHRQAKVSLPESHAQEIVTTAGALQTRNLLSDTRLKQSIALNSELGNHVEVKTTVQDSILPNTWRTAATRQGVILLPARHAGCLRGDDDVPHGDEHVIAVLN
jgi:hypothetical protein